MTALLCALAGYLAGSIPFALVVSRVMSLPDPRTYGSGNIGATNVLRTGNRVAAVATLIGDVAKGWVAVLAALRLGLSADMVALVGFAAFLGHVSGGQLAAAGGHRGQRAAAFDWRLGSSRRGHLAVVTRYFSPRLTARSSRPAAWYLLAWGPARRSRRMSAL